LFLSGLVRLSLLGYVRTRGLFCKTPTVRERHRHPLSMKTVLIFFHKHHRPLVLEIRNSCLDST